MVIGVVGVLLFVTAETTQSQKRSAEEILVDIMTVEMPTYESTRAKEPQYEDEFSKKLQAAIQRRCDLIRELYLTEATHRHLPDLMPERWSMLINHLKQYDTVIRETEQILAEAPQAFLVREAMFARAKALIKKARDETLKQSSNQGGQTPSADTTSLRAGNLFDSLGEVEKAQLLDSANTFVEKYPTDKRVASMLDSLAQYLHATDNPKEARAIWKRLLRDYVDHTLGNNWKGMLRQLDGLNKPFELTFTDALSGAEISMQQLRGKVVAIDFWATWCVPCIAEMPHLKALYAKYKNKGVEFIGISMDLPEEQGGRDALINYCKANGVTWAQYYQGNAVDSEFSQSWGITGIPIMFVVDQQGNLYSVSARGVLDTMLPKLLKVNPVEGN